MRRGRQELCFPIASPPSAAPDRITFEVDRLDRAGAGRIVVVGRWYGVRGRRFVRPELILHGDDGDERRVLAELDDKPWAAEDGDLWRATFVLQDDLDAARALELSVGTDVIVTLRGRPPRRRSRVPERRPRIPLDTPPAPAPSAAVPNVAAERAAGRDRERETELSRLSSRLTESESALTRERERRREAEAALERQREEARELSAEVGRVSSQLALAHAAEREAQATSGLLDSTRREHHSAQERYDALVAEHDRTLRASERLREQLDARTGELNAARSALKDVREQLGATQAELDGRSAHGPRAARGEGLAGPTQAPHTDRPLNPSLHSNSWLLRLLAVIVLAAVVIAVYVILHSTILH